MTKTNIIQQIIRSRNHLHPTSKSLPIGNDEAEGGCGVIGLASTEKVAGKHLLSALKQMRNRGNGKGGGIAAVGLSPQAFGVTQEILNNDYLLAIACLDATCRADVEREFINPSFVIDHIHTMPHLDNYKVLEGLEVCPPDVYLYFVRVKPEIIADFKDKNELQALPDHIVEDEIVYQNTYQLNCKFYASSGDKKAFVLSNGKNLLVLKMVGYGDDVIRYYKLEDFQAHVWIGHHRYPTKGKVWHPGGAHPFASLNEALVHNGDFANYFSICEYLAQRNIHPLFLTDTEVSVLLFDLFHRTYRYPLEYVIEAFAPTTERDFTLLPSEKQRIYQMLQKTHIHGSPDGPWFFLIAQSVIDHQRSSAYRLIGITDTSMLRPQVFAIQQGHVSIGFAASEKQAIDAALKSLSDDDPRYWPQADYYWNARGGSFTDGGAFSFTVHPQENGKAKLECTDKFGKAIHAKPQQPQVMFSSPYEPTKIQISEHSGQELFKKVKNDIPGWNYDNIQNFMYSLCLKANDDENRAIAIEAITLLLNQNYPTGKLRRSCLIALFNTSLSKLFDSFEKASSPLFAYQSITHDPSTPKSTSQILVINAAGFKPDGNHSLANNIVSMFKKGYKHFILYNCQGQRFIGNGLGPKTEGIKIHVYGSSGDYLASGIDGAEIVVHGNGQDQLAQIMKEGTLIVHGDVGQTFMYGAKGGQAYIKGNAAGRPLINAVGKPRVVINGTCLDYLAESFMAGNPIQGGGFVIVNGIGFNDNGEIIELDSPYPGNNLFSLASGGAIYLRDPRRQILDDQLNGGFFSDLEDIDWVLIYPYLQKNAELFNIPIDRLLEFEGKSLNFHEVYRKISPARTHILQGEEAWVKGNS